MGISPPKRSIWWWQSPRDESVGAGLFLSGGVPPCCKGLRKVRVARFYDQVLLCFDGRLRMAVWLQIVRRRHLVDDAALSTVPVEWASELGSSIGPAGYGDSENAGDLVQIRGDRLGACVTEEVDPDVSAEPICGDHVVLIADMEKVNW